MKFVFNTATQDIKTGSKAQVLGIDPESLQALPPGRYKVLNAGLQCEPAILDNNCKFTKFGAPRFIC